MKRIILLYITLLGIAFGVQAQTLEKRAEMLTSEMAKTVKLSKKQYAQLKVLNREKLTKLDQLATLREQDTRYLDLRLDQIEEEYNAQIFQLLSSKQYLDFMAYRQQQPNTYVGVVKSRSFYAATPEE